MTTVFRRWSISGREWVVIAALIAASWLIFGTMVRQMVYVLTTSDYATHINFAVLLADDGKLSITHILYGLLVIGFYKILPISASDAGYLAGTVLYVLGALAIYGLMRSALGGRSWGSLVLAAVFAIFLLLVAPIILLTIPQKNLYFGYVGLNVYHNPTIVAIKPFALLLFAFTVAVLTRAVQFSARIVILGVVLVALSLIAKPNFVLVLLPTLLVVIVYRIVRRDTATLKTTIVALLIPMIVLLALQYIAQYFLIDSTGGGITLTFFGTVLLYDHSLVSIALKFLLSILFPLTVYLCYRRDAVRDLGFNLAWLMFLAGAGQMYFLAESGTRFNDANFWWSAQIGLFVLFVMATIFWLRHARGRARWQSLLCFTIFALHLVSGFVVYWAQFRSLTVTDWYGF